MPLAIIMQMCYDLPLVSSQKSCLAPFWLMSHLRSIRNTSPSVPHFPSHPLKIFILSHCGSALLMIHHLSQLFHPRPHDNIGALHRITSPSVITLSAPTLLCSCLRSCQEGCLPPISPTSIRCSSLIACLFRHAISRDVLPF